MQSLQEFNLCGYSVIGHIRDVSMLLNQAFILKQFKSCESRTTGPAWYISAPLFK